jgi:hypothetical protein
MFGMGSGVGSSPNSDNETNYSASNYLEMARRADRAGDGGMAVHLYLAAFECETRAGGKADGIMVDGLRRAMDLAYDAKDRALAEHVFEKLEPYCTAPEVKENARKINEMALDKLKDFGLSGQDVQDMAGFFNSDAFGAALMAHMGFDARGGGVEGDAEKPQEASQPAQGAGKHQPALLLPPLTPFGKIREYRSEDAPAKKAGATVKGGKAAQEKKPDREGEELPRYDELVGYDEAVQQMRERGIGMGDDERFASFLEMLSRRHGIAGLPSVQTMVFRAAAREDASHFMAATAGEMGLPTVRMYMEEAASGVQMLCIVASNDFKQHLPFMNAGSNTPMVLMLEGVDLWGATLSGAADSFDGPQMAQVTRGAREAMLFIRSAVENPLITVMASCETGERVDEFMGDLLDPCDIIDIEAPTADERAAVWKHVTTLYPSLRYIDLDELVRYSHGLSRFDIYMAAREAVEQAYGESVRKRAYVPVLSDNIFDKLAAYQPLESDEYLQMEEQVLKGFRKDLEHIDDLLRGEDR